MNQVFLGKEVRLVKKVFSSITAVAALAAFGLTYFLQPDFSLKKGYCEPVKVGSSYSKNDSFDLGDRTVQYFKMVDDQVWFKEGDVVHKARYDDKGNLSLILDGHVYGFKVDGERVKSVPLEELIPDEYKGMSFDELDHLGNKLKNKGEYEKAIIALQSALSLNPNKPYAKLRLADSYCSLIMKKLKKQSITPEVSRLLNISNEIYQEIIRIVSSPGTSSKDYQVLCSSAHVGLGYNQLAIGEKDKAREHFNKAYEIWPTDNCKKLLD
ncbi:tetratricopeptide repeat protein [Thermodesulfobacteriota bacterium]